MADGVFARPERIGQAFADDYTPWFAYLVMLVKGAAFKNGYAHGTEVVSADDAPSCPGETSVVSFRPFACHDAHARVPAHDRARVHRRDRLYTGGRAHAFEKAIDQPVCPATVNARYVHPGQEAVFRLKSPVHLQQAVKAADQQACSNQQHE